MKKVKLFEEFLLESKGLELVHAYDKDGTMYGTGELVKKQGSKSLIRFDSETEKWFDNKDVKLVESNELDEATTSWSKMMKGVKEGGSGPWSLVAHENGKVVDQKIDIKTKDMLPAHFEALRKENPKAKIHIEDGSGMVVWNESKYNGNISGDAAEYIAKELSHYVKGIINQPNDAVTYFHLKDKSYKGKVIKTLKDIYGLDANDGGIQFSPSPTIVFDNDQILESFVNEAKKIITVTVFGGKEIKYTDKDIQELIDDLDLGADDLPKWIYVASLHNKSFPKKKEAILDLLKKIKDAKANVSINVASDKPHQNEIVFESINESLNGDKLIKKFTEETGISAWDKVTLKSESGTWTVARLWAPKDNGGMNPGLHIELTKGNSREHFQAMDEDGTLTEFGKELKKK